MTLKVKKRISMICATGILLGSILISAPSSNAKSQVKSEPFQVIFIDSEIPDLTVIPEKSPKPKKKVKAKYSASYFKKRGVIRWNRWKWTWYSQKVLPGRGLRIPGRHIGKGGYIMDKNGYICLASSSLKKGTVVKTPFGAKGKVYDCGCAKGTLDVYANW